MPEFIHIRSKKFPILPGEEEELVNEGMYGKALSNYLQEKLQSKGYDVPFVCCEDWGWWVRLEGFPHSFGVCIYSNADVDEFAVSLPPGKRRFWSWARFQFVDASPDFDALWEQLLDIFQNDAEIAVVGLTDEFPLS